MGCYKLRNVYWGDNPSCQFISRYAFHGNTSNNEPPMTNLHIPNSVVAIDTEAFKNCYNITEITIGAGNRLKYLGDAAFGNIQNEQHKGLHTLAKLVLPNSIRTMRPRTFYNSFQGMR